MDQSGPTMQGGRAARPSERVDAACDGLEAAWHGGGAPRIEECLDLADPADRPALLGELVALERELRRSGGQWPALEEYLGLLPAQAGVVRAAFGSSPGPAAPRDAWRDLLFGLLALQNGFTDVGNS
jgi:hypothetical protein